MSQPLMGKRVVVTRSVEQAETMCAQLEALGATAVRFPTIEFIPLPAPELDAALANLAQYDWLIFTSSNAVRFFWQRLETNRLPITDYRLLIAAVGSASQKLLAEKGVHVDFVPEEFTGEQLALGLGNVAGQRILLPRAKLGRPEIIDRLREQGAWVDEVALYETVTAVPTPQAFAELERGVDVLTFTSPSSVRNFYKIVADRPDRFLKPVRSATVAVIGPSTAAEAEKYGLPVDIMPNKYTTDGLITAVVEYL
jgi:uroporphyrinogen-III synthase